MIQYCIELLVEKYDLKIEPIPAETDSLHQFLFSCIILQVEVLD